MWRNLFLALILAVTAAAQVKIEKVPYQGWRHCYRVSNGTVELIVTADIGPRIMRYAFIGGRNLFKEFPEQLGGSGEKTYKLRGGHRLWVAPETLKTSWALDNGPVRIRVTGDVLEATEPADSAGMEKTILVKLAPSGTRVEVVHRVKNTTPWEVEFAPWAMSMMAPGGTAIAGLPPRGTHPKDLLPTNPLVIWAYTNLADSRWGFLRKYVTLRQDPDVAEPQKIGLFNSNTWAAYLLGSDLFIKRATADPGKKYPDFGCSFETFTNDEMLEMETLGPLEWVASGGTAEHVERWSLHRGVKISHWDDQTLDRVVRPLVTP